MSDALNASNLVDSVDDRPVPPAAAADTVPLAPDRDERVGVVAAVEQPRVRGERDVGILWPICDATNTMSAPFAISRDAKVCRRSWNVDRGSFQFSRHRRLVKSAAVDVRPPTGRPLAVVNT